MVIVVLIAVLVILNIINYVGRENLKRNYIFFVEEGISQVSINNASVTELMMLPGIGPTLANRIIEHRTKNGGFKNLNELKKVKGVGDKLFEKILAYIKL